MICAGDFISEYCIQTLHGTNLGQGIFAFYLLRAQTSGSRLPQGTAGDVCRLWYAPPSSAVVGVVHHAVFSVLRIGVHLDTVIFREPRMQHRPAWLLHKIARCRSLAFSKLYGRPDR